MDNRVIRLTIAEDDASRCGGCKCADKNLSIAVEFDGNVFITFAYCSAICQHAARSRASTRAAIATEEANEPLEWCANCSIKLSRTGSNRCHCENVAYCSTLCSIKHGATHQETCRSMYHTIHCLAFARIFDFWDRRAYAEMQTVLTLAELDAPTILCSGRAFFVLVLPRETNYARYLDAKLAPHTFEQTLLRAGTGLFFLRHRYLYTDPRLFIPQSTCNLITIVFDFNLEQQLLHVISDQRKEQVLAGILATAQEVPFTPGIGPFYMVADW